jgi:hypothetical protein
VLLKLVFGDEGLSMVDTGLRRLKGVDLVFSIEDALFGWRGAHDGKIGYAVVGLKSCV